MQPLREELRTMRNIPAELVKRYEAEGWWTQETLGDLVAGGLQANPDAGFRVHSDVRPFAGTFRDVELRARRLAAGLRSRGVGPGDVVAIQLPNWVEAAVAFWASAVSRRGDRADRALLRAARNSVTSCRPRGRRSSSPPRSSGG